MQVEKLALTPVKNSAADYVAKAPAEEKSFGEFLGEALKEVNNLQLEGKEANLNLAAGRVNDVSEVVIATEKAGIALQLTNQVRNKMVEAYQEIMRMQV